VCSSDLASMSWVMMLDILGQSIGYGS